MKLRLTRPRVLIALFVIVAACGDNLIRDPSFDLWCGQNLCAPWQADGGVTRVGTWHKNDYGVALEDGASLSQLSDHAPVKCIEFSIIADVDARAGVQVEMDFQDDGTAEYEELVPESHWATLRYLVNAPSWYHDVRFIVRKLGTGHAVLAQIKATSSDDCEKIPAVELLDRPSGAACESAEQCTSGSCTQALPLEHASCAQCERDTDCEAAELCGVQVFAAGVARACHAPSERVLGAACAADAECASGVCCDGQCSECCDNVPCMDGKSCAAHEEFLTVQPELCAPGAKDRAVGEACTDDSDCGSDDCQVAKPECYVRCEDESCGGPADLDCGFLRRLAGACR
jgi:hypothetical protein